MFTDPAGLLSLPEGFSYSVVSEAGVTLLESGHRAPQDADGMASFVRRGGSGSVLVCNHEIGGSEPLKVPQVAGLTYDAKANGGTTTIEVDKNGKLVAQRVSIAGTHNNCAGGRTPWETWITCEETEAILAGGKRHGYCFEVDPHDQAANQDPQPIKALGRFAHESVAVDPFLGRIYMTEDAGTPNGLFYRWTPPRTSDGSAAEHDGQVWFLDPRRDTIELKLHIAYTPSDQDSDPDGPDNITVSPYGGVILAEDGEGLSHLVGATRSGATYCFARNELNDSEFAGPTFSRDRRTLFANVQSPGYTFAIRGPFRQQFEAAYTTSPWRSVFSVTTRGSTKCSR